MCNKQQRHRDKRERERERERARVRHGQATLCPHKVAASRLEASTTPAVGVVEGDVPGKEPLANRKSAFSTQSTAAHFRAGDLVPGISTAALHPLLGQDTRQPEQVAGPAGAQRNLPHCLSTFAK